MRDLRRLATARLLGTDLGQLVTYDTRMAGAAEAMSLTVVLPR